MELTEQLKKHSDRTFPSQTGYYRIVSDHRLDCFRTMRSFRNIPASARDNSLTVKGRVTSCYVGQTVPLWISFSGSIKKSDRKVIWKSSDKSIATVNNRGEGKTKKAGTVKITATLKSDSSKKASYKLKVKKVPNNLLYHVINVNKFSGGNLGKSFLRIFMPMARRKPVWQHFLTWQTDMISAEHSLICRTTWLSKI